MLFDKSRVAYAVQVCLEAFLHIGKRLFPIGVMFTLKPKIHPAAFGACAVYADFQELRF